jgi:hypothetical protein
MAATVHQIERETTPAEELEQMLRDLQAEVKALKDHAPADRAGKLELTLGALTAAFNIGWDAGCNHRPQLVSAVS